MRRDGITAWVARPSTADRTADVDLLAAPELARMRRLARQADQDRFSVAWAMTRRVLGERLATDPRRLRFDRTCVLCGHTGHGKPRLPGATLEFSITHAADRVLLAVTEGIPVGVDVERLDARVAEIADSVRHPSEHDVDGPELVRLWVRKEAILKATGHGLVRPMTDFSARVPGAGVFLADISLDGDYVAAVAALSDASLDLHVVLDQPGSS